MDNFNFGEQHCRLCLSTLSDEHINCDFKDIKDVSKNNLDVFLLQLNLDSSGKYMCNVCSWRIMEAFRFKSMCVCTDNTIISYVYDETIDLKEIYMKQTENKHLIPTLEDYEVCRLCMQLVKDKFIPAHEMAVDMIKLYIPEINLTIVRDPVLCVQCFDSFVSHSNFIGNCLEVNKKIKSFHDMEVVNDSIWTPTVDSCIKTEEIYIKSEHKQEDEWFETDSTVEKSVYKAILTKTNHREIKAEDEDEKSISALITDSVLADSYEDTYNVQRFQYETDDSSCKQKYSLNLDLCKKISVTEVFECDTCDYKAKRKDNLKIHQLKHKNVSETEVFQCDTCDYNTKLKYYLKNHQLTHKDISEAEVFECDTCGYKTKYKSSLKKHVLTHKDISVTEVFKCDSCDYKTKRKDHLRLHRLTHKNIFETKIFECDTCDYKTKRKDHLKLHHVTHKNSFETEIFECDTCDYKTKRKDHLRLHLLTHKNISELEVFECHTCDYKTKRKDSLKNHLLTHKKNSETEVFQCDRCDYKSKLKHYLKRHQLKQKHISETEIFECDTCDYKTMRKNNLKKHQLIHKDISVSEVFKSDM